MQKQRQVKDARGRVWTIRKVHQSEAEEADFEFWYHGMTPAERVLAVYEALESSLKAQGTLAYPDFEEFIAE